MKPLKIFLLLCLFQLLIFNCYAYAASMIDIDEMIVPNDENEIFDDNPYIPSETLPPSQIKNLIEEIEEETYIYNIDIYNLNVYNLVSLENADIRCHVRGSIWIGGTLTGSQYVDDGSLDGESSSNSYVYENQSTIYFKSRTVQQSQDTYYKLAAQSVIDTTNYWQNILSILPKDSEYIKYVEPDENGYVDIKYWDYQSPGADTATTSIPILYWTDATRVDMGGLAGHLVAPYADIYITYCNHCGSIVGKTITTDGESHLNYWIPTIETEIETEPITEETKTEAFTETQTEVQTETQLETQTETEVQTQTEEEKGSLVIKKTLYCNVWHTECDVMGDQYWVKDEISNPKGIKSKEGHRKDHCGAIDSWYVYLDEYGKPYAMLEMKAGSTNNKIPLPATFYTDETFTEKRDPATVEVGERIYWTTENKGQVWHHTGVTRLDIPKFEFIVDDTSYYLEPGETLELEVSAGNHTIIEKYDKEYIINDVNIPFSVDKDGNTIITVDVVEDSQVEIDFENRPKNMPEPPKPPETEPITETETETESESEQITETESEIESEVQTETETELITEVVTESETETEKITESESESESETERKKETEVITEQQTEKHTEKPTEKQTEKPTEKITEKITEKQSEKQTEKITEKQSEKQNNQKPPVVPSETIPKQTEKSTEKLTEKQTEKLTEKQSETKPGGGVLGASRGREETQSETDETYELEANKKKKRKSGVNGASRETEAGLFQSLGSIFVPKTGDTTPIGILTFAFGLSVTIIIYIIFYKRYNKK